MIRCPTGQTAQGPIERQIIGLEELKRHAATKAEAGMSPAADAELLHHLAAISAPEPKLTARSMTETRESRDKRKASHGANLERWKANREKARTFLEASQIDLDAAERRYRAHLQEEYRTQRDEHLGRLRQAKPLFRTLRPECQGIGA